MAKYYGKIGFIETVEVEPGMWEDKSVEYDCYGDVERFSSRFQPNGGVNDDIVIDHRISILLDPLYANMKFQNLRYVTYMGTKWKVTNAEVAYPRIILTTGGVYNG